MQSIERVRQLDYFDFIDRPGSPSNIRPRYLFASAAAVSGTNLVKALDRILHANDAAIEIEEELSNRPGLLTEDELNLPRDELMRLLNQGGPVGRTTTSDGEKEMGGGPV